MMHKCYEIKVRFNFRFLVKEESHLPKYIESNHNHSILYLTSFLEYYILYRVSKTFSIFNFYLYVAKFIEF